MIYKLFLIADLLAAAIAVSFFGIGIADGTVSSFNIGIWSLLLLLLSAVLFVGMVFKSKGKPWLATATLGIVAVPTIAAGLFILIVLITNPRWN
jgi:hypothetical protein